jgi:PIN domain nuclease of toxin-antitoxin system
VRLLLDTHVFLWAASDPAQLSSEARSVLEDGTNDADLSIVSGWEIAIKQSLGKLMLARPAELWVPDAIRRMGLGVALVDIESALRVRALPWHHRDPFDRLLAAQALDAGYTLVTRDQVFAAYGVAVVRA